MSHTYDNDTRERTNSHIYKQRHTPAQHQLHLQCRTRGQRNCVAFCAGLTAAVHATLAVERARRQTPAKALDAAIHPRPPQVTNARAVLHAQAIAAARRLESPPALHRAIISRPACHTHTRPVPNTPLLRSPRSTRSALTPQHFPRPLHLLARQGIWPPPTRVNPIWRWAALFV